MVFLRAEECVATLSWHFVFGRHAVLRDSALPVHADAKFHRSKLRHWRVHQLAGHAVGTSVTGEQLRAGEDPSRSDAFRSRLVDPAIVLGRLFIAQAAGTDILRASKTLNWAHLVSQSTKMGASPSDVTLT